MPASTIHHFPGRTLLPRNPLETPTGAAGLPSLLVPLEAAPPHQFQQFYPQDKSPGSFPRHAVPIKVASTQIQGKQLPSNGSKLEEKSRLGYFPSKRDL